ncbi:hypothetical protein LNTAR_22934 [Lentisphaera araneosa HTCC2155]|uniref:Uncharacterized protein n=1 Tax=Lentisphaera araneosa HTCC2155 TaxID=313628 RepID=A6DGH8_9BACT|nr:hypothetical protein [Lentisphaera araneosa]EDM29295.1 hypothetical protein LNTAR_22934 [Lentisphaera araneosa HTCC2155]
MPRAWHKALYRTLGTPALYFFDQKISFLNRVLEITLVIDKSMDNLMAGGGIVRNF